MVTHNPRIGIIGSGAIGGFYGLMLARAGFDVHFLLRSEYNIVHEQGMAVDSAVYGQLHMKVQAYASAADMPPCDWLLVGAKATSNRELAPLIIQAAAPGAKVVLLQNGLGVEAQLRPSLRADMHLLGGLCFICVNRQAPAVVRHQALGTVNLGYHSGPAEDAGTAIVAQGAALFQAAKSDPCGEVRAACIGHLCELGYSDPQFLGLVESARTDADPYVRDAATAACAKLMPK